MASAVRVRSELKDMPSHATQHERDVEFKKMFTRFKKSCSDAGVQHAYKLHEHYESPGQKDRRKRRESKAALLKAKLRESFPAEHRRDK